MGYYTTYELKWNVDNSKTDWNVISDEIARRQNEDRDFFYGVDSAGDPSETCKWYEHEEELKKFSKLYPDVLFELSGEGEDPGDIWKKYFKNGKMQVCMAELKFPSFDESKME